MRRERWGCVGRRMTCNLGPGNRGTEVIGKGPKETRLICWWLIPDPDV